MIKKFSFILPTSIEFGVSIIEKIGQKVIEMRKSNTLIITNKGVNNAGLLENIKKSFFLLLVSYCFFLLPGGSRGNKTSNRRPPLS